MASQLEVSRMDPPGKATRKNADYNGPEKFQWFLSNLSIPAQGHFVSPGVRSLQNDMVVQIVQDVGLGVPKAAEEAAHLFAIDLS